MTHPRSASGAASLADLASPGDETLPEGSRRCDFCGDLVSSVRRVALDREYDRLQKAHQERYSCSECFEKKEQDRIGMNSR